MNLQVLSREQCLRHLLRGGIGRVATTHRALPAIIPVQFKATDDAVLFHASGDELLLQGCDGKVIAFEIDKVADDGTSGWSVLVVGVARLLGEWVALDIGTISGRAVGEAMPVPA